jgi:hypothetical protein
MCVIAKDDTIHVFSSNDESLNAKYAATIFAAAKYREY